jgi:hypothetical protein
MAAVEWPGAVGEAESDEQQFTWNELTLSIYENLKEISAFWRLPNNGAVDGKPLFS